MNDYEPQHLEITMQQRYLHTKCYIANGLNTCLTTLIKAYRLFISPIKPTCCRFYPSCSEYAIEALATHGIVKGSWLSIKRILRCHPFHPGGVDCVPDKSNHQHSDH